MTPITITLLLAAAALAGSTAAWLIVRSKLMRKKTSNIVDLAAARRRKMREASLNPIRTDVPKRKSGSVSGAEIRGFTPKNGDARLQACIRCQKKSDTVGFYVDEYGKLVGVCNECRKSAKNRDLMPL
ncbi:hypothetical protein [Saccharibacillus sacchari]|uniref:hypothetical protein n=1 Tax=Saccharibacillus sacchari TaxID=456493 RepID=UPI0004BC204B|nr:hypothetical protein [Saccharibacillus sacchari]